MCINWQKSWHFLVIKGESMKFSTLNPEFTYLKYCDKSGHNKNKDGGVI